MAALVEDLLAHLSIALDEALQADVATETPRQPLVATLFALGDARVVPAPERVLAADLSAVADDVLTELRLRLADAGLSRLRLSGAVGARLALRSLD